MARPIITVENISKRYDIGHLENGSDGLRHHFENAFRNPWLWLKNRRIKKRAVKEEFWALREINFEVGQGEAVGIIGRNGAGKSTLLKILSRITEPTSGRICLRGRVASLLEVGTGFHQELTGRENIFLNGAILGMSKAEITKKFDEIVEFSEIDRFLDTPVKRYSSGMYVRLAFAVAAHLEPDILIVDEVLAVGDAGFQRKCLGKIQDVTLKDGRTVLFVSHSMAAISRLCNRGLLLRQGRNVFFGDAREVIAKYNEDTFKSTTTRLWTNGADAPGDETAKLRAVRLIRKDDLAQSIDVAEGCSVEIEYELLRVNPNRPPIPAIQVLNENGLVLFASADFDRYRSSRARATGIIRAVCQIPGGLLAEGRFTVLAAIVGYDPNTVHALVPDAISFQAVDRIESDVRQYYGQDWPGIVRPHLAWSDLLEPSVTHARENEPHS